MYHHYNLYHNSKSNNLIFAVMLVCYINDNQCIPALAMKYGGNSPRAVPAPCNKKFKK